MRVIRYHTSGKHSQVVSGLEVHRTAKKIWLILMQPPIQLKKVPLSEEKFITDLATPTVKQTQKALRQAAKVWGTKPSKEAKRFLRS